MRAEPTDGLATELRCETCIIGLERFTLGRADSATGPHYCRMCGAPACYVLPRVPECPATDVALTRHADGTLHWDGDTGLCGADGAMGEHGEPATAPT